jgi:thiol-disulfide isomerase/thioredoxin
MSVFETLFGANLEDQSGKLVPTAEALAGVEAVGIYFSAHWCPPCRAFTPVFGKKYQELKAAGKKVEVVFASSDSDAESFSDYASSQPWIRLPYSERAKKEELSAKFGVRGIPTLVFLDGTTGDVITTNGRSGVTSPSFIEDFPYHPKPVYDLSEELDGIESQSSLIVFAEACDQATKDAISAALLDMATNEKKLPEADRRVQKLFTAFGGGPISQIRKGTGQPAEAGSAAVMVILNLADQGAYYTGSEEVNAANLESFVAAFKAGTLERQQWKR